jgi:hypothetical protein
VIVIVIGWVERQSERDRKESRETEAWDERENF